MELYWEQTDPTDMFGQFEDRGDNYRPVIFYTADSQREVAEKSKEALQNSGRFDQPIVTTIEPAQKFWPAEDYHQGFYKTNPERYALSSRLRHKFWRKTGNETAFYTYLMRHRAPVEVDDVTRLANLAFADTQFPKQSKDFDEVSTYPNLCPFYFNLGLLTISGQCT